MLNTWLSSWHDLSFLGSGEEKQARDYHDKKGFKSSRAMGETTSVLRAKMSSQNVVLQASQKEASRLKVVAVAERHKIDSLVQQLKVGQACMGLTMTLQSLTGVEAPAHRGLRLTCVSCNLDRTTQPPCSQLAPRTQQPLQTMRPV